MRVPWPGRILLQVSRGQTRLEARMGEVEDALKAVDTDLKAAIGDVASRVDAKLAALASQTPSTGTVDAAVVTAHIADVRTDIAALGAIAATPAGQSPPAAPSATGTPDTTTATSGASTPPSG